tara:strand:+ start:109 stop:489 length:381 start_codon:yes stop_codon:yes gene_type:complete
MRTMRFKKLDMNNDIDKKILLTYFYKKLDTRLEKDELLTMSCISYDWVQEKLYSHTTRFVNELAPYKNEKILKEDVDDTLKKALSQCLKIQEELVRCDLPVDTGIDHFYITVIGVDFFMTESECRK